MKNDNERIIDIDDEPMADSRPTEVPEISIEREAYGDSTATSDGAKRGKRKAIKIAAIAIGLLLAGIVIAVFLARKPSVKKKIADNISVLSMPYTPTGVGTELRHDSVLGVAMDFYSLDGLSASLEREFPDTADRSLVLFMRSADYHADGRSLGPVVVDGISSDDKATDSREGYVAVSSSGRIVIGISPDDDMEKWAVKNKGGFFRQIVLLDDGEMPRDFILRGKVERGAIASTVDGSLYYVVTRDKESMYDFADALREYGFVDAVYMTGGNAYSFHRDAAGNGHINNSTLEKIWKYTSRSLSQPLLVFRNAN